MNYIYLDNFRGFSDTLIPILDVNFLVGENSTGKTSILGLLKLLSPSELLFNEGGVREIGFGTFKDVVSIGSQNQTSFSIGQLFDQPSPTNQENQANTTEKKGGEPKPKNSLVGFVLTFAENEGLPRLTSLLSYRNGLELQVKFSKKIARYKAREIDFQLSAEAFAETKFTQWVQSHREERKDFKNFKFPSHVVDSMPMFMFLSFIESQLTRNGKELRIGDLDFTSFFHDIAWLAPIRSKPRKTYDEYSLEFSPEGDHTPYLIKKKLDSKLESKRFKKFLQDIGDKSGLFKDVEIRSYGRGATAPFELDIVLGEYPLSVSSVGYGVSQALPVLVEIFARPKSSWIAIQQPEVHLHPKAQAALGEVFLNLAVIENKKFIVETHSDYTIDRYRIELRKSRVAPKSQILFFERTDHGNKVSCIRIDETGDLDSNQPESYRDFFVKEQMRLLEL